MVRGGKRRLGVYANCSHIFQDPNCSDIPELGVIGRCGLKRKIKKEKTIKGL